MTEPKELTDLTRHIPARLIEPAPQGKSGHYVPHFVIVQALLALGHTYDWELVEILRGTIPEMVTNKDKANERTWPEMHDKVIGVVYRLTIEIDGRVTTIEEAGSCEAGPWDWNDGERLKKAASDALKRCGMRLGVALHLWCKRDDQFFIHRLLTDEMKPADDGPVAIGGETDDEVVYPEDDPGRPFTEPSVTPSPEDPSPEPASTDTTTEALAVVTNLFPNATELTDNQQAADQTTLWDELYAIVGTDDWLRDTVGVLKANTKRVYQLAGLLGVWPPDAYTKGVRAFAENDPEVVADERVEPPVVGMSGLRVKGHMARFAGQTVGWMRAELAKRNKED